MRGSHQILIAGAFGVLAVVVMSSTGGVTAHPTMSGVQPIEHRASAAPVTAAPVVAAPVVVTPTTVPVTTAPAPQVSVKAEQVTRPPVVVVRPRSTPTTTAPAVVTSSAPATTAPAPPVITAAPYRPVGQTGAVTIGDGAQTGDPVVTAG